MLRFHFTPEDLTRLRIATAPHPLWEIAASLHRFQTREGRWAYAPWYRTARSVLCGTGLDRTVRTVLLPLFPRARYFPDFLTPADGAEGLDAGLESILAAPDRQVAREVTRLREIVGAPAWTRKLTDGGMREQLVGALRAYHHAVITPFEDRIHGRLHAERTRQTRTLCGTGIEGVLNTLAPSIRWRPPVLELGKYPTECDIHLNGRGLLLIPSYFCWNTPVSLADPDLPPVLLYPLHHSPAATRQAVGHAPLHALLGTTRTGILRAAATGATTSEAARHAGVTPTTASHHTTVLRDAGLITSHRHANTVLHALTPLGASLLQQNGWHRVH